MEIRYLDVYWFRNNFEEVKKRRDYFKYDIVDYVVSSQEKRIPTISTVLK